MTGAATGIERLQWTIKHQAGRTAVVDVSASSSAITYGDLGSLVERIAQVLSARKIGPGSVIAYQVPNWWEFTVLTLAIWRLNAIAAPLLPGLGEREIAQMLTASKASLWIIPRSFRGRDWRGMAEEVIHSLEDPPVVVAVEHRSPGDLRGFGRLSEGEGGPLLPRWGQNDMLAQLLFTSGTTGEPKGVLHSHGSLTRAVERHRERFGLGPDDRIFVPSPMAHQTGFLYGMLLALYLGATGVYLDQWEPNQAAAAIRNHGVTFVQAALPFLVDLGRLQDPPTIPLFVATGSSVPNTLVSDIGTKLRGQIVKAWGSTETGLATSGELQGDLTHGWNHDGCAMPGAQVFIRDAQNQTVLPGTEGKLWVRTDSMFVEYLNHPEWRQEVLDDEGFFDTGDLAVMDDDGNITITGREKDVINRGGEKIPVVEVEALLYQCPGVADVAIVAMPDERLGERALAYIVPQDGAAAPGFDQVIAYLQTRKLAKIYWPERVEVLNGLPRTASGKVQKFKLRQMAAMRLDPEMAPSESIADVSFGKG